jgi:GNAT superfamily N-acetyltransferase
VAHPPDPRVETLVAAFRDTPVAAWAMPDAGTRARALPHTFAGAVRHAERHGGVISIAGGGGVALWVPDAHVRVDLPDAVRAGLLRAPLDIGPARLARLRRYEHALDEITRTASAAMPFAYLWFVAVRPELRGTGLGRQLVEGAVAQARAAGFGQMLLRTQQPANEGLYRHLGFAELARAAPLGGPESAIFGKIIRLPRGGRAPRPLGSSLGALE